MATKGTRIDFMFLGPLTQPLGPLLLPPATKLGQGYVFTCVCDSVHRQGWYPSMPCSRSPGGFYPSMPCRLYPSMPCRLYLSIPCRSPGPHPGGVVYPAAGSTHPTGMHSLDECSSEDILINSPETRNATKVLLLIFVT